MQSLRYLMAPVLAITLAVLGATSAFADEPSTKAQATQKLLKSKISVEFKNTRLEEALDEIKDQVKGLKIQIDSKGGVSRNSTLSFTGKDLTVEETLKGMLEKGGLGYQIISNKGNAYDGLIKIVQGKDQGKLVK